VILGEQFRPGTFRDRKGNLMNARLFAVFALAVALASPAMAAEKKVATNAFPVPVPRYIAEAINEAAAEYDVDPNLIAAMAFRESRFDPAAISRAGAIGVMQLKPRTAKGLGVKDIYDARENVFGGTKYIASLLQRFGGDVELALAGYNAGPELVAKKGKTATQEAVEYVAAVKAMYRATL
jgi:soluble lytic murein transglycosylase-like protein